MAPLRVLVANKFWYRRAGLERVMFDEVQWLQAAGHEVAHFSTQHPENDESPWSRYFVPYLEIGVHTTLGRADQLRAVQRMFWNYEAAVRFRELLADFQPHLVHIHGIHRQLSPSILAEAARAGVPVIQTLHDYHPICPADDLLLRGDTACDPPRCTRFNVAPCTLHRCVQNSASKSAVASLELLWRRWVLRVESRIDAFISPSHYLARIVAAGGIRRRPMYVLPNAIPVRDDAGPGPSEPVFVYAGRLSREKGLLTLLQATRLADVPLVIAGDGPLRDTLKAAAPPGVSFLGRVSGEEVDRLLLGCRAAVLPSEWAENAPMAVLEPMALARPVVATRMGGIPEQVRDGVDGILVDAGDPVALAAALRVLADDPPLAARLGSAAREHVTTRFDPTTHTEGLLRIYSDVLKGRSSPAAELL